MKFRTDFVTNSSDSSFLAFNIKNDRLFECLKGLGISFKKTSEGKFSDRMIIELPSGETEEIDGGNNWSYPYLNEFTSISAWLVGMLLWEVEDVYPPKSEDEYSDFSKELITLLHEHDLLELDWENIQTMSRDKLIPQLEESFGAYDGSIESARVEHTYGFEGEAGPLLYTEVNGGKRRDYDLAGGRGWDPDDWDPDDEEFDDGEADDDLWELTYSGGVKDYARRHGIQPAFEIWENGRWTAAEDDGSGKELEDKAFVITGKLKLFENRDEFVEYIEELGGRVVGSVSSKTDFLICNDTSSTSSKMKKAKELGVEIITEEEFIRRFGDPEEFDLDDEDEDE